MHLAWKSYGGRSCCDQEAVVSALLARLKVCRSVENVRRIHAEAVEQGIESDIYMVNCLIDRYGKCGSILDARQVFDTMQRHRRNLVSWNSLLFGYALAGEAEQALDLYSCMDLRPDARTFVALIKACTSKGKEEISQGTVAEVCCVERARGIEDDACKSGCDVNMFVASGLVDLYARCGSLSDAWRVFSGMKQRDLVCWNSLILGLADHGGEILALEMFERMKQQNQCSADGRTFVAALKACRNLAAKEDGKLIGDGDKKKVKMKVVALEKGMALHCEACKRGLDKDVFVGSCLVDLYAECGSLPNARRVFDRMESRNVVSWNALILGCAENGEGEMALEMFFCMECQPDCGSVVAALKACSTLAAQEVGEQVDGWVVKVDTLHKGMRVHSAAAGRGLVTSDVFVMNSLVDMYSKCGSLADAIRVFQAMPRCSVVTWNALLLGCVECGQEYLALKLFTDMQKQGFAPDNRTFIPVLMACGGLVSVRLGKAVHAEICRGGFETDPVVETCLVDFYGRCGCLVEAQVVFDASAGCCSIVTWNALIAAYSRQGEAEQVFRLFQAMGREGVDADPVTFVSLLTACSHAGLVSRGREYFELMSHSKFGIETEIEHYHCMIDILGRANHLDSAVEMVKTMRLKPTAVTWRIVLAACRKWKNVEAGRVAFDSLRKLENKGGAGYVLMSAIYGSRGLWEQQSEVEAMRVRSGASTRVGRSWWSDDSGGVHEFSVGSLRDHPQINETRR